MKKIFVCLFLSVFYFANAQTITKNPGDFETVRVFDKISVQLFPAKEAKVELKGARANEVELINKGGALTLRMPLLKLLQGESIEAVVYFVSLESVEANEGTFVVCTSPIENINFKLNVKEGAQVSLFLKTSKTTVSIASGGILKLQGTTDNQDIVMKAGGELDAKDFISKQTTISVNAGGIAYIFATEFVEAKVRAGGSIYIHGKPRKIDQKTVISGEIMEVL